MRLSHDRSTAARLAILILGVALCASSVDAQTRPATEPSLPHLRRTADLTQLIVDGRPFLILGGELGNSTAAGHAAMEAAWPRLRALHLNTVIAPVYWELIEPREGQFEWESLDRLIDGARQNHMRLVLLWFGAWKNSMSSYAPAWVKHDWRRFPRVTKIDGTPTEILTPFSKDNLAADASAFEALMRHLRETDGERHTVLIVQVENEIGMIPEARDHGPLANAAFAQTVPKELTDHVHPAAGGKDSGTWTEVFGNNPAGEEVFTAWHFATYVNELIKRGKAIYPLPMYVNAALNRPGRAPGQYPAGGPVPHLIDVWRAGAPQLDMLSPDVYFFNFADWVRPYHRPGNAVLVPEAMRSARASANAMYAIAQLDAIGFSPFGIEAIADPEHDLLSQTYSALSQLAPQILAHQGKGDLLVLSPKVNYDGSVDDAPQTVSLGDYDLTAHFAGGPRPPVDPRELTSGDPAMRGAGLPPAGGMILRTGPDAYTVVGIGLTLTHATHDPATQAGLLDVQEWTPRADGHWAPDRWLNGDQTNQGRQVFLPNDRIGMIRVRLYSYRAARQTDGNPDTQPKEK